MSKFRLKYILKIVAFIFILSANAFAHKDHIHPESLPPKESKPEEQIDPQISRLVQINESYRTSVKPIFQKKCFDCHGTISEFPWYHSLPGIKQLIDSDIKEAKEHLDFSNDFPFKGHGTAVEDLEAIRDSVNDSSMPPFLYLMTHKESHISDSEKRVILDWLEESAKTLKND